MSKTVSVTETVRDAWQGLPHPVPTERKIAFVQALLDAGFRRIDVGSFVSPRAVPAMADTGAVLAGLRPPEGVVLTALVANGKGLERLLAAPHLGEVLYPFSLSESFQLRNTRRTREQAFAELVELTEATHQAGLSMYATISMAFGNDEGDPFSTDELARWIERLSGAGVDRIGLADTTAQATPALLGQVLRAVDPEGGRLGVHLHTTAERQTALVRAALDAGCRDFDAALGGLGGCQFAKGPESNVSTLPLAQQLAQEGHPCDLPLEALGELDARARALAAEVS